ncbi:MAG: glucosiduronase, partial [Acidobacteriaceae bacterium]|nr:glucosiduronase [Acidobacteriaceae bacterium]
LHGRIDEERYQAVLHKLEYQAGHAIVWRDAVCNWFHRESGIADDKNRVGNHPDRIEAESMSLDGYQITEITPWEDASGGKAVTCPNTKCAATARFEGQAGWYNLSIQYFDQHHGASRFEALLNHQSIGSWVADDSLPSDKPNSHTSTRHTFEGVPLRPGDEIQIIGIPDGAERATLDYIEWKPAGKY